MPFEKGHVPSNYIDITGQRFNRLLVIEKGISKSATAYWKCLCDCGNTKTIQGNKLKSGESASCGCLRVENTIKMRTTHGMANHHPLYKKWSGIKRRCYNPNEKAYKYYGAKGITMSDSWKDSFENFYADMFPTWQPGLTIERKKNHLGYSKDNCEWIPFAQQARNTSLNKFVEFKGESHCLSEWAEITGININRISRRLIKGWSVEKTLTTPVRKMNKRKLLLGV